MTTTIATTRFKRLGIPATSVCIASFIDSGITEALAPATVKFKKVTAVQKT